MDNSTVGSGLRAGEAQLHRADGSRLLDRGVRVGLVVFGVMHLVIAGIALQMALGRAVGQNASGSGAFSELARSGLGQAFLAVTVLGFLMLVVWQAIEAAIGHRDEEGRKRTAVRAASAGRAVVYAVLGMSAATTAVRASGSGGSGGSGGGASADSLTARLMSAPGGQMLVIAVGLAVVAVGAVLVHRGVTARFTKHLDAGAQQHDRHGPIVVLGKVGYVAKGVALGTVGVLVVLAGVRHNAQRSGGLDAALRELLQQPFGGWLVGAIALGLGAFGLYCFAWARHLKR